MNGKVAGSIATGVFVVTIVTFLVKILGFIKQMVIAYVYGASANTDVFFISSEFVTNIASAVFSALSVMFIPLYLEKKEFDRGKFVSDTIYTFLIITLAIVLIGEFASGPLALLLSGGSSNIDSNTLTFYLRILMPTLFFTCMVFIYKSILDAKKVFVQGRVLGAIQSVVIIVFALILGKKYGVNILLASFCFAAIIEYLFLLLFLRNNKEKKTISLFSEDVRKLMKQMLPLCIGSTVADISVIIDKIIAANLGSGVASSLAYGQTLKQFVSATIIMTCISVVFVYLSEYVAKKEEDKTIKLIDKTMSINVLILIPVSIISFFCSKDIVQMLFERGAFTHEDTYVVSSILRGYSIGFVFLAGRAIFSRVCYAFQDTMSPMINGIIAILFNIFLSITLSRFLGAFGITVATSLAYLISSILLYFSVKKKIPNYKISNNVSFIIKVIMALIVCSVLDYTFIRTFCFNPVLNLLLVTGITLSTYIGILTIAKCRELDYCKELVTHISHRRR